MRTLHIVLGSVLLILVSGRYLLAQQNAALTPSEQLAYSTVRIEVEFKKGAATGTGFFLALLQDSSTHIPVLVTNKHVVRGAERGRIVLTGTTYDGMPNPESTFPVLFDNFESLWIPHPDPDVDLAIMPIAPLFSQAEKKHFKPFLRWFDKSIIPSEEALHQLTAVEDILMIGYPVGIWDRYNNYPIFRKGITATHPANRYDGRDEFMIDAACFPGSSGSPVLLFNIGSFATKDGNVSIGNRILLLGILYGGPQYTVEGEIRVVPIPDRQDTIATSRIPINLGNVVRSGKLLDFEPILQRLIGTNR